MPPELVLRAPALEDAPAVAALLNRVADADDAGWVDEGSIRNWFTNPNLPVEEDAILAERDGALVAYADVYRGGEAREKVWGDLRLPPEERGGETLPRLVDWMEERAGGARFRLSFPAPADEIRAEVERRGYTPVRYSFEMELELDEEPPPPAWPEGVSVRTLRSVDEGPRIHAVDEEAFADHWDFTPAPYEEWRHWHMEDRFDPSLWFLAEEGDEIAGICLCHEREGRPDMGWVESLAVRRPWRRRGLGLALLHHAFAELRRRGYERAGLGVDGENLTGAVRLYERAGMHVARRSDTYERPAP